MISLDNRIMPLNKDKLQYVVLYEGGILKKISAQEKGRLEFSGDRTRALYLINIHVGGIT